MLLSDDVLDVKLPAKKRPAADDNIHTDYQRGDEPPPGVRSSSLLQYLSRFRLPIRKQVADISVGLKLSLFVLC